MPCDAHFGIIDDFDKQENYQRFFSGSFQDTLREHHCVPIDDDILNDWAKDFQSVSTYYNSFSYPAKGFAQCAVTLVPPESIAALIRIVETKTSAQWREGFNIDKLLELLKKAHAAKKFVIVYGV